MKKIFAILMVALAAVVATTPARAQSRGPVAYNKFPLLTTATNIAAGTTVTFPAPVLLTATGVGTNAIIKNDAGYSFSPYFVGTGASTANVIFTLQVSLDGTNYSTTTNSLQVVFPLNGTTPVRGYYNFPLNVLDNAKSIGILSIQNTDSGSVGVWVTNITVGHFWSP